MDSRKNIDACCYWVVVPAAGIGARMGADCPKQYLQLAGKTLLEQTLERLLQLPQLAGILLALHPEDSHWFSLPLSQDKRITVVDGGQERSRSVLNALNYLSQEARAQDWVLVHDAARPCITLGAINELCRQIEGHPVGGLLGVPLGDTLKQIQAPSQPGHLQKVVATLDRSLLWQAQTPQAFRCQLLRDCLTEALARGASITDEASAMELAGYQPLMVEGRGDNIKVTRSEDLALAELILQRQEQD